MTAIQLNGVSLAYSVEDRTVPVLKDVTLNIKRGEMAAICGPSGSGKSTLLYLLGCLLKPDLGQIKIDGVDVSTLSDFDLASFRNQKIGFVFQQFFLLPKTSVLDNVLLPAFYPIEVSKSKEEQKAVTESAKTLLNKLGLDGHLAHMPNQLSGGQQQRAAIARALINGADIILADEPTGNLDSKSAAQVMEVLKELWRQGKTVIIITHDENIASQCERVYRLKDGHFEDSGESSVNPALSSKRPETVKKKGSIWSRVARLLPLAKSNLVRHRVRSQLTMLGVAIGVAAVMGTLTLGAFTKEKVIQSYAELGVNTLQFHGFPNYWRSAEEAAPAVFRSFDEENDIKPVESIFPEVKRWSPLARSPLGGTQVFFGGKKIQGEVNVTGVNEHWLQMAGWKLKRGHNFHASHISERDPVCIVGADFEQQLFGKQSPLGELLYVRTMERTFTCKIIGVLEHRIAKYEFASPNLGIYLPYTYSQTINGNGVWDVLFQLREGASIEKTGKGIKANFERKYGSSGVFIVDYDSVALEQMIRFLDILSIILAAIALISLMVGGMGITNMMLVSVAERMKEIGIRKAVGATNQSIRMQFVIESMVLCFIAGLVGLLFGFFGSEAAIYVASKLTPKLAFEWRFDSAAMLLSVLSIVIVGVLSGLSPALKAEKVNVVEALRSE